MRSLPVWIGDSLSLSKLARYGRLLVALWYLLSLAGCYTYVVLPGEVTYEKVSPPYVLQILNRTGSDFSVEPTSFGRKENLPVQKVGNGASFEVLMQVRGFRVGKNDRVGSHQVLDGPYITQDGSNTAVIILRHSEKYDVVIDLESEKWLESRSGPTPSPTVLKMEIENFTPKRWFRAGPP